MEVKMKLIAKITMASLGGLFMTWMCVNLLFGCGEGGQCVHLNGELASHPVW
jgi:hypothetical protein